jgi:hypothetical protein
MTKQIAKREPMQALDRHAYEPRSWQDAAQMAEALCRSGMLPKGVAKPAAALAVIVQGREFGLTAMQSLRSIHVIDGKPTFSADMMVALVHRSGLAEFFRCVETTGEAATFETKRKGEPSATRLSFTVEDAKAAGLLGRGPWSKHRAEMLRARAKSHLARLVYPDVLAGVDSPGELGGEEPLQADAVVAEVIAEPEPQPAPTPTSTVVSDQPRPTPAGVSVPEDFLPRLQAAVDVLGQDRALELVGSIRELSAAERIEALQTLERYAAEPLAQGTDVVALAQVGGPTF